MYQLWCKYDAVEGLVLEDNQSDNQPTIVQRGAVQSVGYYSIAPYTGMNCSMSLYYYYVYYFYKNNLNQHHGCIIRTVPYCTGTVQYHS